MEVWVAGATGVLGRHTVPLLIAAGHTVVGLARDLSKWPNPPPEMRFIPCDITQSGQVIQTCGGEKPDAIIHLATAIPPGRPAAKDWERNDQIRRTGTQNLVDAALVADAYYVQQSVHYVLAPQGDNWITEDAPFGNSPIMASAVDSERITQKGFRSGLRGAIIRPSTLYTTESGQTQALLHGLRSGMPVLVGNGLNFWSFIHPYDVGTAIVRILAGQPPGETYDLCDDEPARMKDFLLWLAQEIHTKPPKSIAPFLAKMAIGGEMVDLLTGSRRIANVKAKQDLGWQPHFKSFREGFTTELTHVRV